MSNLARALEWISAWVYSARPIYAGRVRAPARPGSRTWQPKIDEMVSAGPRSRGSANPTPDRIRSVCQTVVALLCLLNTFSAGAQTPTTRPFDFYEHGPYRDDIPRPSQVFGYEPGAFHTTYAQYESLLRQYQDHSDRLRVFQTGKTAEHRALYLLAISSPKNIGRLDAIKDALANISDPRKHGPEIDDLLRKTAVVVWLS